MAANGLKVPKGDDIRPSILMLGLREREGNAQSRLSPSALMQKTTGVSPVVFLCRG
jgi:hypothetical protein